LYGFGCKNEKSFFTESFAGPHEKNTRHNAPVSMIKEGYSTLIASEGQLSAASFALSSTQPGSRPPEPCNIFRPIQTPRGKYWGKPATETEINVNIRFHKLQSPPFIN
jgi:hypothetical protein